MTPRNRGIALLLIQLLLVSSVAGKYLYERATRPSVWVRVAQFDPELPIRGRYLMLSPEVNVCSLTHGQDSGRKTIAGASPTATSSTWRVLTFARDGHLVVEDAEDVLPRTETQTIWLSGSVACDRAPLTPGIDFFIPDTARSPFPLKKGQELWAEVTVPAAGPPRAIQLAMNDDGKWRALKFE